MPIKLEDLILREEKKGNYGYNYPDEETYPVKKSGKTKKSIKDVIKTPTTKKTYKEGNISKSRSDLKKTKSGEMAVETELNVKKGLEPKVKRALKKSIIEEVNKKIKGGTINLDYSSSSDEEDTKEYSKMLSQLINHIKSKKEPLDKKEIIDTIVKKKRGRPRKN